MLNLKRSSRVKLLKTGINEYDDQRHSLVFGDRLRHSAYRNLRTKAPLLGLFGFKARYYLNTGRSGKEMSDVL
jgi:hypothetical protein